MFVGCSKDVLSVFGKIAKCSGGERKILEIVLVVGIITCLMTNTSPSTRQFVIEPKTRQRHDALDSTAMRPCAKDLYRVYFQRFAKNTSPNLLEARTRAFWCTILGKKDSHPRNWVAFVASAASALTIQHYGNALEPQQTAYIPALHYWQQCRLLLEEHATPQTTKLDAHTRNALYETLFDGVACFILAQERTPCDMRLVRPGLTPAHVREARRIWEQRLRTAVKCDKTSVWYSFVRYCASMQALEKQSHATTVRLALLRACFPQGYHELDSQSPYRYIATNDPPRTPDVLNAYEQTQAFAYLLSCRAAIRNVHLTQGKHIHQQRQPSRHRRR